MMKTSFILGLLCCATFSFGQSLDQYVIGSVGDFGSNSSNSTLSWTIGEVVVNTASSGAVILTQGFQQPIIITTEIANLQDNSLSISVFPNPTLEQITIQKEGNNLLKAELINTLGQVLATYNLSDNSTSINLNQLAAANYLLRIQSLDKKLIQTFKIQKIQ